MSKNGERKVIKMEKTYRNCKKKKKKCTVEAETYLEWRDRSSFITLETWILCGSVLLHFRAFTAIAPSVLLLYALIFKRSHLVLPCLLSNIHSKHSSLEPAGGELKHYDHGNFGVRLWTKAISNQIQLDWRTERWCLYMHVLHVGSKCFRKRAENNW